jgi:hypothetical protein
VTAFRGQVGPGRDPGDRGGVQDDLLGVAAGRDVEPVGQPDHGVARGQARDAGTGLVDHPGDVPADAGLAGRAQDPGLAEQAGPDGEVDGVDGRGRDADPDLPRAGLRDRRVDQLQDLGTAELPDHYCAHDFLQVSLCAVP